MSERTDRDFIQDVLEASHRVAAYTAGMSYDTFLADTKTQDAVIRNLEIIGEAAKNLSDDLRHQHSEIPWKSLAAVRDKLIHHYFGVNLDIVWQIVTVELPQITTPLTNILK